MDLIAQFKIDITEQTASGVPARPFGRTGRGIYLHKVILSIVQIFGHIDLESDVAVVGRVKLDSIDIDITVIHKSVEIKDNLLALPL